MSDNIILIIVFFVIGIVMFAIGSIFYIFYKKKRNRCSVEVIGTVVDMASQRGRSMNGSSGREVTFHQAVYEYEVRGEKYYSPSTVESTARPKYGKQRVLFVNPDNPNEIIEKRFVSYIGMVIPLIGAVVFWLVSIIVAICTII